MITSVEGEMAPLAPVSVTRGQLRTRSRFLRITGLAGEIMLTLGVVSGLFLGWHLVLNELIQGEAQTQSAREVA